MLGNLATRVQTKEVRDVPVFIFWIVPIGKPFLQLSMLADLGGVNTLTRPKASTWTAPNRNTMFSDLFGEPEAKPETRQP